MPGTKNVHKQLGSKKGNNYREIRGLFGVNTTGTENLFRLEPVPGHGARVLPLELVHGAQNSARAPTKGYVQTGTCARAPSLNRA